MVFVKHARLLKVLNYDPKTGVFTWCCRIGSQSAGCRAGTVSVFGYRMITIDKRTYYSGPLAHFYMTGHWPQNEIDHVNRVRSDDRWCNLRPATKGQNAANRPLPKSSKTGARGVYKLGSHFVAHIKIKGRLKHLGCYPTITAASAAYKQAAIKAFGEFANV